MLKVISEHGVPQAGVTRVAEAAGVSEGTLYKYFNSRTEMLIAALDSILAQMLELIGSAHDASALERLRTIGKHHSEMLKGERGGFTYPWVEFIAAGPQVGLREAVARTQQAAFKVLSEIVEEGKAQGTIREDIDTDRVAWAWYTFAWAENISCLIGLNEYVEGGHSAYILDLILKDAAPQG